MATGKTAAKERRLLGALLAAFALLLPSAAQAARWSPSQAGGLAERRGPASLHSLPAAEDLALTYPTDQPSRFPLFAAADQHQLARHLAAESVSALTSPPPPGLASAASPPAARKLASGRFLLSVRSNLWDLRELAAESRWRAPIGQTLLFHGLWTDPVTGLAYARARWYSPRDASWLSEDPAQDIDSPNLYSYVAWQPQMATDPMGLQAAKIERGQQFYTGVFGPLTPNSGGWGAAPPPEVPGGTVTTCGFATPSDAWNYQGALNACGIDPTTVSLEVARRDQSPRGELSLGLARGTRMAGSVAEPLFDATMLFVELAGPGMLADTWAMPAAHLEGVGATGSALSVPPSSPLPRPSWQAAQATSSGDLGALGFETEPSYLAGRRVPYGTKGSVRPDYASEHLQLSVDVKNYDVTTPQGRWRLVKETVDQAGERATNLPEGMRQGVVIDIRGQQVSDQLLQRMIERMVKKSNNVIQPENVYVRR